MPQCVASANKRGALISSDSAHTSRTRTHTNMLDDIAQLVVIGASVLASTIYSELRRADACADYEPTVCALPDVLGLLVHWSLLYIVLVWIGHTVVWVTVGIMLMVPVGIFMVRQWIYRVKQHNKAHPPMRSAAAGATAAQPSLTRTDERELTDADMVDLFKSVAQHNRMVDEQQERARR